MRKRMRNACIFALLLMGGCASDPVAPMNDPCAIDADCRNGYHCNLFFNMCEADEYDAGVSDSSMLIPDDGGMAPDPDAGMMENDSGIRIIDASDAGMMNDSGPPEFSALHFDGDGGQVILPNAMAREMGQEFTFEAWVRPSTDTFATDIGGFIVQRRAGAADITIYYSRNNDGRFGFQVYGTLLRANFESAPGEWHHVAGCFNWGQVSLFVDGAFAGATNAGLVEWEWETARSYNFVIGREGAPSDGMRGFFIGDIDEVRISNSVRYRASTATAPPFHLNSDSDTVALYLIDEGSGITVNDDGPFGFDGTMALADWVTSDR